MDAAAWKWKGVNPIRTPGGEQDMLTLTEQGLYFFGTGIETAVRVWALASRFPRPCLLASPPPIIPLPSKRAFWRTERAFFGVFR